MTHVLLRMTYLKSGTAIKRETTIPNSTTLKALRGIIQDLFGLGEAQSCGYEVLGCAASGHRARLRDLTASGITRFHYLQSGASKQAVEIAIVPPERVVRPAFVDRTKSGLNHPQATAGQSHT
ncbi:hypothetical protein [Rhizomicrobium electricum]|uniref:Uncharacterized protein n=1 Tax=Rhizomicrobium electricum TaxID=480070 RepID=A0ABP3PK90_9PROT|nr:hypothetical protein [Rhizomicrobium electricum]NIJ48294.1 hypothetical protein [Rhizomicrobium electricum]